MKWKLGKEVDNKTNLVTLPSGTIDLEVGGDGVYLRFDCDCADALPYCKARCCALPGTQLSIPEMLSGEYEYVVDEAENEAVLKRRADGYCVHNDAKSRACTIYDKRPTTCQVFHCTRQPGMRGWQLGIQRMDGGAVGR